MRLAWSAAEVRRHADELLGRTLRTHQTGPQGRLVKRQVPLKALSYGEVEKALGGTARQKVSLQKGIPSEKAREIVKVIKNTKIKVQAAIQGDQVRVTGKNRDDLQAVIRTLKETDLGIDMQFTNYR